MTVKNENRPGYKKTKVGWIPEGWDETALGDFTKWGSGGTPSKANDSFWNGDIPWISAISMHTTRFSDSELKITKEGLKAGSRVAPKNSLLILVRGSMLFKKIPVGIAERDVAFNQDVKSIIPDKKAASSNYLLCWLLGHEQRLLGMVGGTGIGAGKLDLQELQSMEMALPPLPEQEAIAEVLECWDKGIRTLENKIVKKRLIKKGLMQKLLSGKIRLPGFSKPWENVRLAEVLTEHKENGSGKEEVHSVSVHKGVINQVEHLGRSFSAKDTTNYNLVKPGDIIYTKSPTGDFPLGIIKQSMLTKNAIVSPLYGVFTPMTKHLGLMLHCFFDSPVNTGNYLRPIIQKGAKNTINITNTTFLSGKMTLPLDKKEQRAIAAVLTAADREIEALERKLALWKDQKKFLLNNLVTGTIRLPEFV